MKVYALAVLSVPTSGQAVSLASASDLSSFSFYQRGSVAEFMTFFCKTVAERTKAGQRQSVQENAYVAHVYNRGGPDPLCSVVVTDQEYPVRPAFSLLAKILDEYDTAVPVASRSDTSLAPFPAIHSYLSKYQDPKQADNIMKVQAELDETKIILHQTIESVLERGEKLDNLSLLHMPPTPPNFYQVQLTVLAVFCFAAILLERYVDRRKKAGSNDLGKGIGGERLEEAEPLNDRQGGGSREVSRAVFSALQRNYLFVYAVVMGADWLQGPYVYSLYKDQYEYPERIVALLFVMGFTSAGLTAPLVGVWADKLGRRRMCLYFCLSYAAACFCTLVPFLPVLLAGRVLGGFSTSILFSCFESWLVSASQSTGVSQSDLSTIFGQATLVNGFVASAAGIVSNELVARTEGFTGPFMLSALLLGVSWVMIRGMWTENYGGQDAAGSSTTDFFQITRLRQAWQIVRRDPSLLVLGLTQTCFEGSMYLFVFLWVPSMQEASAAFPGPPLPLGYIFSAFMVSMMLGSLIYTCIATHSLPKSDPPLVLHAKLSSLICLTASLSFAFSYSATSPQTRFWCFCIFEACVGMYYPVQGMLKGTMISNDHRATLAALFRVPLNVFVTGIMLTGVSSNRQLVFSGCTLLLAFSSIMTTLVVVRRTTEQAAAAANGSAGLRPL
ncbi:hypothetical protein FRB97_004095 [Tulasnella sp. 331]|nr:hypothetical protein FRB97_004095 [Tulasnella sp. 331]